MMASEPEQLLQHVQSRSLAQQWETHRRPAVSSGCRRHQHSGSHFLGPRPCQQKRPLQIWMKLLQCHHCSAWKQQRLATLALPSCSYPPLRHALCTIQADADRWLERHVTCHRSWRPPDLIRRLISSHKCSARRDADPFRPHHNSRHVAVRGNAPAPQFSIILIRQPLLDTRTCTQGHHPQRRVWPTK